MEETMLSTRSKHRIIIICLRRRRRHEHLMIVFVVVSFILSFSQAKTNQH